MKNPFPLFQSHLDLAHRYWTELVQAGDTVIDATCGNGYDTLKLCQLTMGKIYALDIQREALDSAKKYLSENLPMNKNLEFHQRCHSSFPESIQPESIKLIVYNLGYLPGGQKTLTTQESTTIQSLNQAIHLIQNGGAISLTCYPGHPAGAIEQKAILEFTSHLSPKEWNCCHHTWPNRNLSPSLLIIQRGLKSHDSLIT